jgi:Bifunctional DNA primase/polymerase, N-terminal
MNLTRPALSIWHSRGWALFPTNADKSPACAHGYRDASTDEVRTRALFDRAPNATLIAAATGPVSGVSAIDIDPAALEWFEQRRRLFRPTWAQRTPRGGWHLLYEHPPGLRCSAGRIHNGIDIRAEGGSCVIWGRGYEWVDGRDPAPFPAWILAAIARADAVRRQRDITKAKSEGDGDVAALARFVARAHEGTRNTALNWAAYHAGSNAMQLLPAAIEIGLPAKEARATILCAMRAARADG